MKEVFSEHVVIEKLMHIGQHIIFDKNHHSDNCGRYYPHVYEKINIDSVVQVLLFLRDDNGNYIKNPEFKNIAQ